MEIGYETILSVTDTLNSGQASLCRTISFSPFAVLYTRDKDTEEKHVILSYWCESKLPLLAQIF